MDLRAPDAAQRFCGALLIRGPWLRAANLGPGSAVHREVRCTASGTRDASLKDSGGFIDIAEGGQLIWCRSEKIFRRVSPFALPNRLVAEKSKNGDL
jgi:hypothetical protein